MQYTNRGSYEHANRARQLLRFDGLKYNNITPMDLDGLIEWHDRKRVLLEIKLNKTPVPYGERLALERMVKDFQRCGKESLAIIADHKVFDIKQDVKVEDCLVRELYHSREQEWRPPKRMMTVRMLLDSFLLSEG